jgi:hypothetical protein
MRVSDIARAETSDRGDAILVVGVIRSGLPR